MGMELHLTVTESAGRLTGTARRSDGEATFAFSGALELLACIERLCLATQATVSTTSTHKDN
jgi:hypothetical protein